MLTWSLLLFDTVNRGMKKYCLVLIWALHPIFSMKQSWVYHLSYPSASMFFVTCDPKISYLMTPHKAKSIGWLENRTFLQGRKIGLVQWSQKHQQLWGWRSWKAIWNSGVVAELRDQSPLSIDKVGNCANCRTCSVNPLLDMSASSLLSLIP